MDEAQLSRKERDKLRHRKEILRAALSLFSGKGFHNVSMQEIAQESEFGIGTLYTFFESKEQLFAELMKTGIEKIVRLLIPILDSDQKEDRKISEFVRAHVDIIEGNMEIISLYLSQYKMIQPLNPMLKDITGGLKKTVTEKLESVIESGIRNHIFRRVHPEITALSLRATLETFCLEASEHFDKAKIEESLLEIERLFLNVMQDEKVNRDD